MSEVQAKRAYSEVLEARRNAAMDELARAKQPGGPVRVSRLAAAVYLGISYETIKRWEAIPFGPPKDTNTVATLSGHERVYYLFKDLEEWVAQGPMTAREKKKAILHRTAIKEAEAEKEELRREIELLKASNETKRLRQELEDLKRKSKALGFATLADVMVETDWVARDGFIVGHVTTVSDEDLLSAIASNDLYELTLDAALCLPWSSQDEREHFHGALRKAVQGTEAFIESMRERSALETALPPASARPKRPPL